jgi:hypothetical protein
LAVAGRHPAFRDVLSNAAGALIGYGIGREWESITRPQARAARLLCVSTGILWAMTQLFTSWAMALAPPSPPWWAQLKPRHGRYPTAFAGDIAGVSIGSLAVKESDRIVRAADARRELIDGAALRVTVTSTAPSLGLAPIVIISAGPIRDVASWAQDGSDAMFAVAVRGTRIGLRTPSVRLPNALPPTLGDTIALAASFAGGRYVLRANNDRRAVERRLSASPSLMWAFLLPFPSYAFGSEVHLLTALWLIAVWMVLGYWGARAATPRTARHVLAGMAATLGIGLALAPLAFGIPLAHWSEWLAATVAAAGAWLITRRVLTR